MKKINMDLVEKLHWNAADILRGVVGEGEVGEIVLKLYTLKVLSDNDDHPYKIPPSAKWNNLSSSGHGLGYRLSQTITEIELLNPELRDLFLESKTGFEKIQDRVLFQLIQQFDRVNLNRKLMSEPDPLTGELAQITEKLFETQARSEGKAAGEFSTPKELSFLLARLLNPKHGTVYDGVAGLGSFLIEAAKAANKENVSLYGQEINFSTWVKCRLNLILHGLYEAKVVHGDTIRQPGWLDENRSIKKFDYILMNPPMSLRNWGREEAEMDLYGRFRYGIPSANIGDMAFVQHAVASMSEKGKAALIVPPGVLIRGGAEQRIRSALLNEDLIDAVIGLPATNPYGSTKVMSERILSDIVKANPDWMVALLRYFNPVGAHESGLIGEDPKGIPNNLMPYITKVAKGELDRLRVFGDDYPTIDGTGVRDYIHVMDLAEGHMAALDQLGPGLHIYNLGTGKGTSVLQLVRAFEEANGVKVPYEIVARRPGDIAECYADASKAWRDLGWKTRRDLLDMCRDAWRFEKNNI